MNRLSSARTIRLPQKGQHDDAVSRGKDGKTLSTHTTEGHVCVGSRRTCIRTMGRLSSARTIRLPQKGQHDDAVSRGKDGKTLSTHTTEGHVCMGSRRTLFRTMVNTISSFFFLFVGPFRYPRLFYAGTLAACRLTVYELMSLRTRFAHRRPLNFPWHVSIPVELR
jgi:hypothetical protein